MLKFVKSQETYAATLEQFAQTDALAHGIAARPQRIAKLIQQGLGETFHGGSGGYFGQQHRDFHARLVVDARMQAREIGDDRSLAPAAFAHDGATVWLRSGPVAVKTSLDPCHGALKQRILHQHTFRRVRQLIHPLPPAGRYDWREPPSQSVSAAGRGLPQT